MATEYPRSRRTRRTDPIPFNLSRFERHLRAALNFEGEQRSPGEPGSFPPDLRGDPGTVAVNYLFSQLMDKRQDGGTVTPKARREKAWEGFWLAEKLCKETNQRLSSTDNHPDFVAKAQDIVLRILGPAPDLDRIAERFHHGPGASTRHRRGRSSAAHKYSGHPQVTPGAYPALEVAIATHPYWRRRYGPLGSATDITVGNRLATVPKKYSKNRMIGVEPDGNVYLQLGTGSWMKVLLKKAGIDLHDQTRNQELARSGEATIDFTMASDTVSILTVMVLLKHCPGWLDWLDDLRSKCTVIKGVGTPFDIYHYEKFSSMGNGYTFELETLIFLSLARAVVPPSDWHRVSVYGDDVVVPECYAEAFLEAARYFGFVPNLDKTFVSGPFKESCGKHFYNGHDVTPFYIKRKPSSWRDVYLIHNQLQRWLWRTESILSEEQVARVNEVLTSIRLLAPERRRLYIPDNFGDGGFVSRRSWPRCPNGQCGYLIETYLDFPIKQKRYHPDLLHGILTSALTSLEHGKVLSYSWRELRQKSPLLARVLEGDPQFEESMYGGVNVRTTWRLGRVFIPTSLLANQVA